MKQKILDVTVLAVLATALWHAVHPNVGIAVALVAGAVALAGRKSAEVPAAAAPAVAEWDQKKDDSSLNIWSLGGYAHPWNIYWGDDD